MNVIINEAGTAVFATSEPIDLRLDDAIVGAERYACFNGQSHSVVTVDSMPADFVPNAYSYANGALTLLAQSPDWIAYRARQAAALQALQFSLMAQIDDAVASRLTKSTRFSLGYEEREAAAIAYKAAGYAGDPTSWITRFAVNTGKTSRQAADIILAQAVAMRGALKQLEDLRMDKYLVMPVMNEAGARAAAAAVLANIEAVIVP